MDAEIMRLLVDLRSGVSLTPLTWVAMVATALLSAILGGYLADKGKNLATREDIEGITRQVEGVKSAFATELEEVKAVFAAQFEDRAQRNRLRLAALDKRLEAHQQAFVLWRKLLFAVHTEQIGQAVGECQNWWDEKCLYLSAAAREAFPRAWSAALIHAAILRSETAGGATENWNLIEACGAIIIESAGLPGFTEREQEAIANQRPKGG